MAQYSNLWFALGDVLCERHNLEKCYFIDKDPRASTIRKKAYFLLLLEIALFEYRKNEVGIWLQQSPEETLHSFVYSKTGILPEQFDKLSNKTKLMVLHKPLSEAPLPEVAQSYLKNLSEPAASDNFEIDPFEGWILGTGWQYLEQE